MIREFSYEVRLSGLPRIGRNCVRLRAALTELALPPDVVRRTAICLYEAESNMVIHAGGGEITIQVEPDAVRLCLRDRGPGITQLERAMETGYSTADTEAREEGFGAGLGLPNMQAFADALEVSATPGGGTTIRMKIKATPRNSHAATVRHANCAVLP